MNILWKQSDLPFFTQERTQKGEKRGFVYACKQTQLDDFAHEQTIICRQLFASHVVGFWLVKKKTNLYGSHILSVFFFRISNQALLSQMKHLKNWRTAFVVLLLQLVLYSLLCFFLSCTCCGGHAWSADIKAMFLKGIFVTYWSRVCQSFRYLRFSWSAEEQ